MIPPEPTDSPPPTPSSTPHADLEWHGALGYRRLEARVERSAGGGTVVRLPVRIEHVTPRRQTVVVEEVTVRATQVRDIQRIEAPVRRETVDVQLEGDLEATQPVPARPTPRRRASPSSSPEEV